MKDTQQAKLDAFVTQIANRVTEAMENGVGWMRGWVLTGSHRKLSTTDLEPYQGSNQFFLGLIALLDELEPVASDGTRTGHVWGGYNTWLSHGFRVRKGEKAKYRPIRAYTFSVCAEHDSSCDKDCRRRERRFGVKLLRAIFHVSQVEREDDDAQWPQVAQLEPVAFDGSVREYWAERGVVFKEVDPDRAFFTDDYINLPPLEAFASEGMYNGTVCHEVTHWSGHKPRLNRVKGKVFGDKDYAREELVAELGAMMLMTEMGLEPESSENHDAYLASWIKALKEDPSILYHAATDASKAIEYLMGLKVLVNAGNF
jgi:antirestriction protein ArdC